MVFEGSDFVFCYLSGFSIFVKLVHDSPSLFKNCGSALAGVAQWLECWPANEKVSCLIPGQSTRLGCKPGAWMGMWESRSKFLSHT